MRELRVSAKTVNDSEFLEKRRDLVLSAGDMSKEQLIFRDTVARHA